MTWEEISKELFEKRTAKRFTYDKGNLFDNKMNTFYHIEDSDENIEVLCNRLNELVEENEQLKRINKRCSDSHLRMRNRLERLHKDWDKLWDICKDKGMTDEEIIKEMER